MRRDAARGSEYWFGHIRHAICSQGEDYTAYGFYRVWLLPGKDVITVDHQVAFVSFLARLSFEHASVV